MFTLLDWLTMSLAFIENEIFILFITVISDISTSVPGQKLKLFADDTNIFVTGRTLKELEDKANSHILNLNMWLIANKLHLNRPYG